MVEPVVVPVLGEGALENASSVGSLLSVLLPFSDPDKALGQSAAPRWFLSVSVLLK